DAHLETFEVFDGPDLLAEPATHLTAGVASNHGGYIELGAKLIHQLEAITVVVPGILLASVQTERRCAEQRPCRILAKIVVRGRVAHLYGAIRRCIEHL